MKKILLIIISLFILLAIIILGLGIYKFNFTNKDIYLSNGRQINTYDGTYIINGEKVTLKNGISVKEITPRSASKIITRYFGNEVKGDFDGDGREDTAFILTQETGGSGIFYYVVARLNTINGIIGSQGLFLGDRIAPQTTALGKGKIIIVNYADRKSGESFVIQPSFGKSLYLLLDTKTLQFGEVVQNFEGEADPARMTLNMKTWTWINTIYTNGTQVKPNSGKSFTLTFKNDKTFSATTDCNGVGGEYVVKGKEITFDKMMSTLMYCEGSQESDFSKMTSEVRSYNFTSKGELILNLVDGGSMIFK
ncbi:MAG: META domain-containing protein [Candidatus Paceibacterota bacterium]|jgi:heat shock protein HslJ